MVTDQVIAKKDHACNYREVIPGTMLLPKHILYGLPMIENQTVSWLEVDMHNRGNGKGNDKKYYYYVKQKNKPGLPCRGAHFDSSLAESTLTPMASNSHSAFDHNSHEIFYSLKLSRKLMNQVTPTGQRAFSYTGALNFTCIWLYLTIGGSGDC